MPHDLLSFVEVLQDEFRDYTAWYEILAMGFRVAPTAGTDFPCGNTMPGHERFYTKVEGAFSYDSWLEGVRNHRTFVTTGPIVEFRINDEDIGGEVFLDEAASVDIEGRVLFDAARDDLSTIELVQNGDVIERFARDGDEATIEFSVQVPVDESTWFALRGQGKRLLERPIDSPWYRMFSRPTSAVHSAPIWVTVRDRPLVRSARSREAVRIWLNRLEGIEQSLAPESLDRLAEELLIPNSDGVTRDVLLSNREPLLAEVRIAKEYFLALLR